MPSLLIFTDLDGTLLDSDSYSFAAARSALDRVFWLGIPLIPTTSKSLAEMRELSRRLANPHPSIVENGGAICAPEGRLDLPGAFESREGYRVWLQGPAYQGIQGFLVRLRRTHGFGFRGFADMSDEEVAADTGLSLDEAARARERLCSEPLIWQDSDEALGRFRSCLQAEGLGLTRGGRYWHVVGPWDKAAAMGRLKGCYQERAQVLPATLALGDSPNDRAMLETADIAVVIRPKYGEAMTLKGARVSDAVGPEGWSRMVHQVLDELGFGRMPARAVGARQA